MSFERLCRRIGYSFTDKGLLKQALTHRSTGNLHNERLEFLGDAILSFVVAEELFQRFPSAREGELTRLRATLVKGVRLADLARGLELGKELKLGSGELKSGGRDRESILADALEALIGAIFMDGNLDDCRAVIQHVYGEWFDSLSFQEVAKDPKTRLQELLQARHMPLPEYSVLSIVGTAHRQKFTVYCEIAGLEIPTEGQGGSRRKAEQNAAQAALEVLE